MRAFDSGRRAGRPRQDRAPADRGTPELQARRERLAGAADPAAAESPLALMLARGLIDREQHDAACTYAFLYRRAVGRTHLSCDPHYRQMAADAGRAPEERGEAEQERLEARFRQGKNRLLAAGRRVCEATENLAVFGLPPRFLDRERPSHAGHRDALELEAVLRGLATLAACYGRGARRAGRLDLHRAPSLRPAPPAAAPAA
ncbi:MAG: hypothetical protein U1E53_13025 [Dongiaceae bacterium]